MQQYMDQPEIRAGMDPAEVVIGQLDDYITLLYNDMADKVKGTLHILQLARNPDNLEVMLQQGTLLGVLSRLLKEDGKRSMELVINIVYIFFSFSNFSQFHQSLSEHQVGDMTMRVIELEAKRYEVRVRELEQLKESGKSTEEAKSAFKRTNKKQEKLLYVCFHVLLNLAEDVNVERKMKKRKIVSLLCQVLPRKSPELVLLALTFLKKLSIFKENKDEMAENHVVELVAPYVDNQSELVAMAALRLLVNLSFDPELRDKMVSARLIPKLVSLLRNMNLCAIVLKLLYHISTDDKCKSMFMYTEAIPMLMSMIINHPEQHVEKTLIALGINLAANARNAEQMCAGDGLREMVTRLLRHRDPLLCKLIRNISQHEPLKPLFVHIVPDVASTARQCEQADLLVELLGILGNVNLPEISFARILVEYDLISFLQHHLQPGRSEDDIILEIVIFIGTAANDPECADILAQSKLVGNLYELMTEKQEDDEMVLQITYTFYNFIRWEQTRAQLLQNEPVVTYLVDLLYDSNAEIRKMADQTLDLIMEVDDSWAQRIRERKFQIHNAEWLRSVDEGSPENFPMHMGRGGEMDMADFDSRAWGNQMLDARYLGGGSDDEDEDFDDDEFG